MHLSGSTYEGFVAKTPNPDPYRFIIRRAEQHGPYVIAEVVYPDATTFEGRKILVYKDVEFSRILNADCLDPHFSRTGLSPVARFIPTTDGWKMAYSLAGVKTE